MKTLATVLVLAFLTSCQAAVHPAEIPTAALAASQEPTSPDPIETRKSIGLPHTMDHEPKAPAIAPLAPTWSKIFSQYLAVDTEGGCGRSGSCHAAEMADPISAYEWLTQRGYIAGRQSALVRSGNSCLWWFGGNMPPRGRPNPKVAQELAAWVAAGAPND